MKQKKNLNAKRQPRRSSGGNKVRIYLQEKNLIQYRNFRKGHLTAETSETTEKIQLYHTIITVVLDGLTVNKPTQLQLSGPGDEKTCRHQSSTAGFNFNLPALVFSVNDNSTW